jgi:hypothetical protein
MASGGQGLVPGHQGSPSAGPQSAERLDPLCRPQNRRSLTQPVAKPASASTTPPLVTRHPVSLLRRQEPEAGSSERLTVGDSHDQGARTAATDHASHGTAAASTRIPANIHKRKREPPYRALTRCACGCDFPRPGTAQLSGERLPVKPRGAPTPRLR